MQFRSFVEFIQSVNFSVIVRLFLLFVKQIYICRNYFVINENFGRHLFNSNIFLEIFTVCLILSTPINSNQSLIEYSFVNIELLINIYVNLGCPQIICVFWQLPIISQNRTISSPELIFIFGLFLTHFRRLQITKIFKCFKK
jgi:hypothetical protein